MTEVVAFPADHLASRISACVDAYRMGNDHILTDRVITYTEVIERELREKGIPEDEVQRQVEAFLVRVEAEMIRAWVNG